MAVILLIENNPVMRPALRDLLQLEGQTVVTAMDVPSALSMLADIDDVDLVIANVAIPKSNSVAMVKDLRQKERYKSLPMLIFSINNNDNMRQQVLDAGADVFLSAPFTINELRESVGQLLRETIKVHPKYEPSLL